jgi:hypothetical protein
LGPIDWNGYADAYTIRVAVGYGFADGDSDCHANRDANRNTHCYADGYTVSIANGVSDRHAFAFANGYTCLLYQRSKAVADRMYLQSSNDGQVEWQMHVKPTI